MPRARSGVGSQTSYTSVGAGPVTSVRSGGRALRTRTSVSSGLTVATVAVGRAPGTGSRLPVMTTWEYATVPLIVHATKQILDQWGADGWELVQVLTMPEGNLVAYLKRPKA